MYIRRQRSRTRSSVLIIACLLLCACVPAEYWQLSPSATTGDETLASEKSSTGSPVEATTATPAAASAVLPTRSSASAANTPGPTRTPPPAAGELRLAVREDIKTLNPFLVSNASEAFVVSLLYDTLAEIDSGGELVANLAERWELASDGLSLSFWLNPQARWHYGQPVTAEDVVFSFQLARQQQFPGLARAAALVDRAEALSPREVKFALLARQADAVRLLATQLVIVPMTVWKNVDDAASYSNFDNPIGSGPFRFVEFVSEARVVLQNTEVHHRDRPRVETLVVEITRDEDQALEALQHKELDAIGWDIDPLLAREVLDRPDDYPGIRLAQAPGVATYALLLNLRKAPFDVRVFRQALAQAIDAQAIVQQAASGFGDVVPAGLFALPLPWRNANMAAIAFEPEEAKGTLESAGFRDRDGDGLRENLDGSLLRVSLACMDLPVALQVAELVASDLTAVGLSAEVVPVAQDEWMPTLMQAQFDVALDQFSIGEPEMAYFYFHSSRGLLNNGYVSGMNYGGYANPAFDELASEALKETDLDRRQELLYQMQDILAVDLPRIALYSPRVLSMFRTDQFTRWTTRPGFGILHRATIAALAPDQTD